MSELGHDLHSEFPADGDILHALKLGNEHFRSIAEQYHGLTQQIYRIEGGLEPASDERLEALKKERLQSLDRIAIMIAQRKAA